jgi:hypothetical protein
MLKTQGPQEDEAKHAPNSSWNYYETFRFDIFFEIRNYKLKLLGLENRLIINLGVWQGVAMDSLKFHPSRHS